MKKSKKIMLWSLLACLLLSAAGWFGWTWYDNNVDRSGWREKDGVTMYLDFHGKPITGWLDLDGSRYYFGADHAMQTGWLEEGGSTYYLNDDGKMQSGWVELDTARHYFLEDGTLANGWQEIEESVYYLDENGTPATGWLDLEKNRYCFDENGILYTGWVELEGETYLFYDSGVMHTGWIELKGNTYLFDETGTMHTGWLEEEEGSFYFGDSGIMSTGWTEIEGNRYFFADTGILHTGWLEQGEYLYYLLPDGTAATGKQEIDGKVFYFTPKGIQVLLVNPWHPIPADYTLNLVEAESGYFVDASCLDALNAMTQAMRNEGLLPMFSSAYRDEEQQRDIWAIYVKRYMDQGYDEATANAMTADFVAVPGTSEHHTGLALDIVGHDYYYNGHPGSTKAVQAWLNAHCWEYGFILRYTAEKSAITGFAAETWHFRYVGTEVSMDMKDSGLCLEEYLGAHNPK